MKSLRLSRHYLSSNQTHICIAIRVVNTPIYNFLMLNPKL